MRVYKCDRCGNIYESYSVKSELFYNKGVNRLSVISSENSCAIKLFDICPDCMNEFVNWIRGDTLL